MKNKRRITSLLIVVGLGLVVIPYMAFAQDGKSATKTLDNEYINLGKVTGYTVNTGVKIPDVDVNKINITKGENNIEGLTLSKPGDYKVQFLTNEDTYEYNIFAYNRGDANIDGKHSVTDLVAAYRRDRHPEISAEYGADMDGSTVVNDTDYSLIRRLLVGTELVLPEPGDKLDEHIVISAVSLTDDKLALNFKNISKVWEAGTESFVEFTCYGMEGNKLDTQKAQLGQIDSGKTASCEITLPANTTSVKVTNFDFGYWSILVK